LSDIGTLRDHLSDVINERNELLRKVERLEAQIYKQGLQLGFMERRLEELIGFNERRLAELTEQQSALWKVDND
jgi:hypothetical protein